jgi:hypothetical protein
LVLKFLVGAGVRRLGWRRPSFRGLLWLGDQGLDGGFIGDGEVGEDFAVDLDAGGLEAFHKSAVGQAVGAGGGVDALDPQVAEGALADLAVTVVIGQGLPNGVFGVAEVFGTQGLRMKKSEDLESEIGIKGCAAALAT